MPFSLDIHTHFPVSSDGSQYHYITRNSFKGAKDVIKGYLGYLSEGVGNIVNIFQTEVIKIKKWAVEK